MPITWKNVNDPSATASGMASRSNALTAAGNSFKGMTDSFTQAVERQQGIRADNRQNTIDNKSQDFRDLVSSASTPEELEAMREQGVFQDFINDGGRMLDRSVANQGAVDDRLTGLRTAETAEHEYQQTQQARTDEPLVNQYTTQIMGLTGEGGPDAIGKNHDALREQIRNDDTLSPGARSKLLGNLRSNRIELETNWDTRESRERRGVLNDRTDAQYEQEQADQAVTRADRPYRNEFSTRIQGITPEGGPEVYRESIAAARADLEEAIANGEVSAGGGAEAMQELNERGRQLGRSHDDMDARDRTQEENERADGTREMVENTNQIVNASIDGFDLNTDTYTAAEQSLRDELRDSVPDLSPAQETAAVRDFTENLIAATTMSEGDAGRHAQALAAIDADHNQAGNIYRMSEGADPLETYRDLKESKMVEMSDGNSQLFGERNARKRRRMSQDLLRLSTRGVEIDGEYITAPRDVIDAAMEGLKQDRRFIWNGYGDLEKAVKDIMADGNFGTQLSDYREANRKKAAANADAFRLHASGALDLNRDTPEEDEVPKALQGTSQESPEPESLPQDQWTSEPQQTNFDPNAGPPEEVLGAAVRRANQEQPQTESGDLSQWPSRQPGEGPLSPRMMGGVGDWFTDRIDAVRGPQQRSQADRVRSVAAGDSQMSLSRFTAFLNSNPGALKDLSSEERNKLRDLYNPSIINQHLDR